MNLGIVLVAINMMWLHWSQVTLLEDEDSMFHLRNLSQHLATYVGALLSHMSLFQSTSRSDCSFACNHRNELRCENMIRGLA